VCDVAGAGADVGRSAGKNSVVAPGHADLCMHVLHHSSQGHRQWKPRYCVLARGAWRCYHSRRSADAALGQSKRPWARVMVSTITRVRRIISGSVLEGMEFDRIVVVCCLLSALRSAGGSLRLVAMVWRVRA